MTTRLMWPTRVTGFSRNLLGKTPRLRFPTNVATRRGMASGESHAHSASSDTPWMIASAVIFGPAFLYLLGPGSAKVVTGHGDPSKDPHPSGHGSAPPPLMQKVTPQQQEHDEPASEPEPAKSEPEKEESTAAAGESEDSKADLDESQTQPSETSTESPQKEGEEKVEESDAATSNRTSANNDANSEQSQKDEPEPSQGETTGDGNAPDNTK